jgi:hypothetical protein
MKKSVLKSKADETVSRIAFKDMTKYLESGNCGINLRDNHGDIWIVTPEWLSNKETRRLNEELGINKINKCWSQRGNNGNHKQN